MTIVCFNILKLSRSLNHPKSYFPTRDESWLSLIWKESSLTRTEVHTTMSFQKLGSGCGFPVLPAKVVTVCGPCKKPERDFLFIVPLLHQSLNLNIKHQKQTQLVFHVHHCFRSEESKCMTVHIYSCDLGSQQRVAQPEPSQRQAKTDKQPKNSGLLQDRQMLGRKPLADELLWGTMNLSTFLWL